MQETDKKTAIPTSHTMQYGLLVRWYLVAKCRLKYITRYIGVFHLGISHTYSCL